MTTNTLTHKSELDCEHPAQPGQPVAMLTVDQVAEWLGLSKWTLYHLRPGDDGPAYYKICGRRRYKRCCVRAWIDEHRVGGD